MKLTEQEEKQLAEMSTAVAQTVVRAVHAHYSTHPGEKPLPTCGLCAKLDKGIHVNIQAVPLPDVQTSLSA